MAVTLVFVHGTGVRADALDQTASVLRHQLAQTGLDLALMVCDWATPHGATLNLGGACLPPTEDQVEPSMEQTQWAALVDDPLIELRLLAANGDASVMRTARAAARDREFLRRLHALADDPQLMDRTAGRALANIWPSVVNQMAGHPTLHDALRASPQVDGTFRILAARALIAALQVELIDRNLPILGCTIRDAWVRQCVHSLGGQTMGLGDWLRERMKGFILGRLTQKARRERFMLHDAVSPAAGDILRYQSNGRSIRDRIADTIDQCPGEVVLMGHSLGGIACMELLVEQSIPRVKALITVGSQAPYLYEIGALAALPLMQPLPAHFPRWINVFDRDDLLSFCAATVFPGRAEDIELRSGQDFPASHSAYWDDPELWRQIARAERS